jgi:hypothetical protein
MESHRELLPRVFVRTVRLMTPANNLASHLPFYQKMKYFMMVRQAGDAGK